MADYARRHSPEVQARKAVSSLPTLNACTKEGWLHCLEYVPQHFWPPRPTRQSKAALHKAVCEAIQSGRYEWSIEHCRVPLPR